MSVIKNQATNVNKNTFQTLSRCVPLNFSSHRLSKCLLPDHIQCRTKSCQMSTYKRDLRYSHLGVCPSYILLYQASVIVFSLRLHLYFYFKSQTHITQCLINIYHIVYGNRSLLYSY